jgi:hypothetical protein
MNSTKSSTSRRKFLLALGAGSAGAAAVVVAVSKSLPAIQPAPTAAAEPSGSGYKLTEHVQQYYKTTRI